MTTTRRATLIDCGNEDVPRPPRGSKTTARTTPPATVTVSVPLATPRTAGRKLVLTPPGQQPWRPHPPRANSALVKALARAFRWKRMLENGNFGSIADLATAEKINASYLSRALRLTLLAPGIVETILSGQYDDTPLLGAVSKPFPIDWRMQEKRFSSSVRRP